MPYRQVWEPAPTNMALPVYKELPEPYRESVLGEMCGLRRAYLNSPPGPLEAYETHFCPHCGGWIPGPPSTYLVSNLGRLSGRSGTEYYCRRCGKEIAFDGIMA